ncbi:uncharacterized protein DSM5745_08843 [Aspergillus mulundensis]|uniref:Uncharacterized protein n=1 Tax=Aspergillus mulundensis TaxID=1810919 RepID=A0A3D8R4V5_9EURO|nr:Uncharacterized protein DSM5745_08843 [Aspergillus mulundensis]RDW69083.1 Uncharacterized protein DSM5745_08843 [Aspergillus mulundensis]
MSSNGQASSKNLNGTDSKLSADNLRKVPDDSGRGADRFANSSSADSPYFARAAMENRAQHMSELKSQLNATDALLKK